MAIITSSVPLPRERLWDVQVPKKLSIFDDLLCPSRPASVALLHAPFVRVAKQLPQMAGRDLRMSTLFFLRHYAHAGKTVRPDRYWGLTASCLALP